MPDSSSGWYNDREARWTMPMIEAVYEKGVLRPSRPLRIPEGRTVFFQVREEASDPQTPSEEWERRIMNAASIDEWVALANSCPDPDTDDGYDVLVEMDKTRRANGERPFIPDAPS